MKFVAIVLISIAAMVLLSNAAPNDSSNESTEEGVNFINILLEPFSVRKCFAKLFSSYSMAL